MPKSAFTPAHKILVDILVAARKEAGMMQCAVAERLGKGQPFISTIETGLRRVDILEFYALARAMDIDPTELFARLAAQLPEKIEI